MKETVKEYNCGNCSTGVIKVIIRIRQNYGSITINKCNACKIQYYASELKNLIEV